MKYLRTSFILLSAAVPLQAFAATIDADTTINEGNPISGIVDVVDGISPPTEVNVAGGVHESSFRIRDASVVNVHQGVVGAVGETDDNELLDESTLNVLGGRVNGTVRLSGSSTLNIFDGEISAGEEQAGIVASEFSTVNLFGGEVCADGGHSLSGNSVMNVFGGDADGSYRIRDKSVMNIFGGMVGTLNVSENSVINLYGTDFNFPFGSLSDEMGRVTGTLSDGTPLDIEFTHDGAAQTGFILEDNATINLFPIPEPSSFMLAVVGLLSFLSNRGRTNGFG